MMVSKVTKANKIGSIVAFVLAIAPILDPYIILEISGNTIRVMDIPMLLIVGYIIFSKKRIGLPNKHLFMLLMFFFVLTLISFFSPDEKRNLIIGIKVLFVWSLYAFCVSYLWKVNEHEKFIKYATNIAIIATFLLIMQFIAVSLGYYSFFDGKIPFLELSKYDQWSGLLDPNTGNIRVNSFFQEPSYFGIYCLPVFAQSLKNEKLKISLFIFFGLVLSSSLVAIMGGIIIALFVLLTNKKEQRILRYKFVGKAVIVFGVILIAITALYNTNNNFQGVVDYSFKRISNITAELQGDRLGSTKIRILGNAGYFSEYSPYIKLFGAGASQYPLLLSQFGLITYSSTVVTVILNYGLIGLLIFIFWLLSILLKSKPDKRSFALIFIIICCIDNFWFNWYFFYILSWFLPFINVYAFRTQI